jgi:hypothetical protein
MSGLAECLKILRLRIFIPSFFLFALSLFFLSCSQKPQEEEREYEDLVRVEEEEEWNPLCSMESGLLPDPQEIILSEIADCEAILK